MRAALTTTLMHAFLFAIFISCGPLRENHPKAAPASDFRVELKETFTVRKAELVERLDFETRWPSTTDCDALLWAGLASWAGVEEVNLAFAERESGVLQRRPGVPCWSAEAGDQGAKSTISNDMMLGYFAGVWRTRDLGALERLAAYGEEHEVLTSGIPAWVMGEPYPAMASRVVLRPSGVGLVGRMLYALSSHRINRAYRQIPSAAFLPVKEDYEEHLQAVSILLEGEIDSATRVLPLILSVTDVELDRLQSLSEGSPKDAFFAAALARYTGEFGASFSLLLDPGYECPSYVRGDEAYCRVHWLVAAATVLADVP